MANESAYKCPSCNTTLLFEKPGNEKLIKCPKCGNRNPAGNFQPVETRKVFCPACYAGVQVAVTHKGILTCPKCKKANDVNAFEGEAKDVDKTEVKQIKPGITEQTGKLVLTEGNCTPAHIILKPGVNVIGRKPLNASQPAKATILLDTADSYMSKKHANIDVILRKNQTLEYRLSDAGSSNGTWHNGEKLDKEEIVVLQPGDKVRIGRTVFEFVI